MSLEVFKNTVKDFNKNYNNNKVIIDDKISINNEKHLINSCNTLNYKYTKLQKKYKNYKNNIPNQNNMITEDDLNKLLKI